MYIFTMVNAFVSLAGNFGINRTQEKEKKSQNGGMKNTP
jgi:hypothetical protein